MGRARVAVSLALLGSAGALVSPATSCSSASSTHADGGPPNPDASDVFIDVPSSDSPAEATRADGGTEGSSWCLSAPPPPGLPAGWTLWTGYDPCCFFYVPGDAGGLPPPIQWAACDPVAQPAGIVCRQMVVNWPARTDMLPYAPFGLSTSAWARPDGGVTMVLGRAVDAGQEGTIVLLADVDGPVRLAVLVSNPGGACGLQWGNVQDDKYATGVPLGKSGGAFAGSLDAFPTLLLESPSPMALMAGIPGALDLDTMNLHDWADASATTSLRDPNDNGFGFLQDFPAFAGSTILWNASAGCVSKLKVWTPSTGVGDFISYGNTDATQGVGDVGTDGHDLVWMYGSGGCDSKTLLYASASIMTAPFTSNPAQLAPRRLTAEIPNGLGVSPFVVGCGYAARQTSQGIRVVRLSDGTWWLLSSDASSGWGWNAPVALTCDELFAKVTVHSDGGFSGTGYARVQLASLGAGNAPQ